MYRIMIADDEGIAVESFTYMIREEFKDTCIIESAKTGRSVIELAERFRPDIALMDIRMPGINGIDAIKEIRKRNPGIIFIVISAYDKFGYAKEALCLGVMDYLNKPVNKDVFLDTLRKAMAKVDGEREKRTRELAILEKMETVTPILENGLVYNLLFQEFSGEDIENFKKLLEINTNYGYMIALVFGDSDEGGNMTNVVGTSVRIQSQTRDLRDIVKSYISGMVGSVMANKIAIFVPYEKKDSENDADSDDLNGLNYNERLEIIDLIRNMVRRLNTQLDAVFRAGVGTVRPLSQQMTSYNEALESLTMTTGSVAHAEDLAVGCEYEDNYPVDSERAIFEGVKKGELEATLSAANYFFDWMLETYDNYTDDIKLKTLEFVLRAESIAYGISGETYRFRSREDYLKFINRVESYDKLRKWFIDKLTDACHDVKSRKENRSNGIIDRAKEYIMTHYQKDISLDDVSREIDISPYYFSKLFKEATGDNFIEYLTNLRIDKAKDLLDNTELSMKEICVQVGYANPNYFSRIFKKNVGVTPTEYKT
ncbi:MAG: response regulator [Eubacterium sp.]|nr:response regulator [Eubacterium sp.]